LDVEHGRVRMSIMGTLGAVAYVEMRRLLVIVIHRDDHPEQATDFRHQVP
jgi:hypothetical protein